MRILLALLLLIAFPVLGMGQGSVDSPTLKSFGQTFLGASVGSAAGVLVDEFSAQDFQPGDQNRDLFPTPYGPTFAISTTSGAVGGAYFTEGIIAGKEPAIWGSILGAAAGLYVGSTIVDDVSSTGAGPSAFIFSLIQGAFTALGSETERYLRSR